MGHPITGSSSHSIVYRTNHDRDAMPRLKSPGLIVIVKRGSVANGVIVLTETASVVTELIPT